GENRNAGPLILRRVDMTILAALALALLASQDADTGSIARWKLDGSVNDSGASALPTKAAGRIEFIDSPVTGSGQMAVLNGVDGYLEIAPPGRLGAGAADFSLSLWVFPQERRPGILLARKGWTLEIIEGGALRFATALGTLTSAPAGCPPAQWNHVVVSVKRAAEGKASRLFVNGQPVAAGDVAEGDLDPMGAPL